MAKGQERRRHNWVTSGKTVDGKTDRKARRLLDCNHLTPEVEAEIDNLIGQGTTKDGDELAAASYETPDDAGQYDWMDEVEPPKSAFQG